MLRSGRRLKGGATLIDARQLGSETGFVRVAIVVPKWGQTAVRRNQLKRRLRELARTHFLARNASSDVVLRAKREAYDATFADLRAHLQQLANGLS